MNTKETGGLSLPSMIIEQLKSVAFRGEMFVKTVTVSKGDILSDLFNFDVGSVDWGGIKLMMSVTLSSSIKRAVLSDVVPTCLSLAKSLLQSVWSNILSLLSCCCVRHLVFHCLTAPASCSTSFSLLAHVDSQADHWWSLVSIRWSLWSLHESTTAHWSLTTGGGWWGLVQCVHQSHQLTLYCDH